MALRLAVVVSQAPGLGGTPSDGHRSTAVANASAAASSARSRSPKRLVREATTRAHSSWWAWAIASRTPAALMRPPRGSPVAYADALCLPIRSQARSQERPHLDLPVEGLRPLGGQPERHVEVGRIDDPEAGEVLLRLHEGTVGEQCLITPVVDHSGRAGHPEATGEYPVPLGLEPLVEHVDRSVLVRGGEAGRVVDHGKQVLHREIISCRSGRPWRAAVHPCYEQPCPDPTSPARCISRLSWTLVRKRVRP